MSHSSLARYPAKTPVAATAESRGVGTQSPKWELVIPDQPAIETCVQRFSGSKGKSFQTQLDRARHYVVPVQEIFAQAGLPKDLVYVALVESGFSPTARSHASAVGMWQFISSTGKRYGLEQNEWVDERCHPFKSAKAAAEYLSFLYDTFGSWELALAAYNAGENGVQAALDRSGLKTFWELADNGYLPAETRDYVPKVLAAVKIIRNPRQYGFHYDPQYYSPKHETVSVPGGVKLAWLEKKTGIPEPALRDYNPELKRPVMPPTCSDYELCVPVGKGETVLTALAENPLPDEAPGGQSDTILSDIVSSGRTGDVLQRADSRAAKKTSGAREKSVSEERGTTEVSCVVKAGDTLFGFARKSGCSPKELAALNGMKTNQQLRAGETIKLPAKESPPVVLAKEEASKKGVVQSSGGKPQTKGSPPAVVAKGEISKKGLVKSSGSKKESSPVVIAKEEASKKGVVQSSGGKPQTKGSPPAVVAKGEISQKSAARPSDGKLPAKGSPPVVLVKGEVSQKSAVRPSDVKKDVRVAQKAGRPL